MSGQGRGTARDWFKVARTTTDTLMAFWGIFFAQVTAVQLVNPGPITDASKVLVLVGTNALMVAILAHLMLGFVDKWRE